MLVFDPMNEYGADAELVKDLVDMKRRAQGKTFRLRYVPPIRVNGVAVPRPVMENRFNGFCSLAYDLGDLLMVCEELQLVTRPNAAPAAWSMCTLQGRHAGLAIAAVSQRPAHVDKNLFSCCNAISAGRLNYDDDIKCLARVLRRPYDDIGNLQRYQFIARDMDTGETIEGNTADLLADMGRPPGKAPRARKAKNNLAG